MYWNKTFGLHMKKTVGVGVPPCTLCTRGNLDFLCSILITCQSSASEVLRGLYLRFLIYKKFLKYHPHLSCQL